MTARTWKHEDHHIWCNFYYEEPPETCSMCARLKKDYAQKTGQSPDDLMKEHFPNNRKVG